ncbi:MAG: polysaccharide pyruvyl transferase family protein [Candidatus Saccharibacteria bacterium]|nr:polysaccharide pyruvyl transferase family protein [Candidatus Saccharibacteria bacterium]
MLKLFWKIILLYETTIIILQIKIARLFKKRIFLIAGIPIHNNLGDQAIAVAEIKFLKRNAQKAKVICLNLSGGVLFAHSLKKIKKYIQSNDIIFGHGGGNMGDQYPNEELARREIIKNFPNNKIIIFPQTMFFRDTVQAQKMLKQTIKQYSYHKDLTLIAREQKTYQLMKEYFKANEVLLTPDIVLSMTNLSINEQRCGAMTCLRSDVEKTKNVNDRQIIDLLQKKFKKVNISDTMSNYKIILTNWDRIILLYRKWRQFSQAEIVVTDRLHGMVFAWLTKTPCVVFSNYNYKVSGTYEWIKQTKFIEFCEDIDQLKSKINKVVNTKQDLVDLSGKWNNLKEKIKC